MPKTYTKVTLPNGMLVLLKEIHTTPLISLWLWYRVGSRDEVAAAHRHFASGGAHAVQGNTTVSGRASWTRAVAREGGTRNAFTYLDWTTYFETMPADKIDLALRLEADRMAHSIFD